MYTLYHHGSSACAAKVRFALAEKGLDWQGVYLDILNGDQYRPDYLKINPKAVVPTLLDGNKVISESTVIIEYLDLEHPVTSLHPTDPHLFAQARLWTKAVDEELQPACFTLTFVCSHRHTVGKDWKDGTQDFVSHAAETTGAAEIKARKRAIVELGFDAPGAAAPIRLYHAYLLKMEEALQSGDWLLGDRFSIADVSMAPYVNRLNMLSMSRLWEDGKLPRVADWFARLTARPTFTPALIDWVPDDLVKSMHENGRISWPEVEAILAL